MLIFLEHIDDVRAIVQKAVKDLAIDQSLKTYDEIWTSKLFKLRLHTRVRTEQELVAAPVSYIAWTACFYKIKYFSQVYQ